eukprot:COSAG04_NODE_2121_length_4749_cov_2.276989_4_plen_99_part_00
MFVGQLSPLGDGVNVLARAIEHDDKSARTYWRTSPQAATTTAFSTPITTTTELFQQHQEAPSRGSSLLELLCDNDELFELLWLLLELLFALLPGSSRS